MHKTKGKGGFYSCKQTLFTPCTEIFIYEIFENILSFRTVFVFDVYLLNLQFRAAGVYSIRVFYSGRLLIAGCHTYQSARIQCAVTERLACFNLPIISLHSSRRKFDEYVTSACTRFSLLLSKLSSFRLGQKNHCSLFEGRSIAKWHIGGGLCLIYRTSPELISNSPCCPCSVQCKLLRPGSRNLSSLFGCQVQCAVRTPPSLSFEVTLPDKLVFC